MAAVLDVRSLMVTMAKLRRVEKLPAAYDAIIAATDDIPTIRRLIARRDAYRRQVDRLRSRVRAASY
jgi:capsule polysaccharide export protein KpsE/RkpR